MTGVCTIGFDSSIKIETKVSSSKKDQHKRVTFSEESPIVINYDREDEDLSVAVKTKAVPDAPTVNCKKCKEKKKINVRMSLSLGLGEMCKDKKSIFDVVFRFFGKLF